MLLGPEWGYFTLSELEELNVEGLVTGRDHDFEPRPFSTNLSESSEAGKEAADNDLNKGADYR